MLSLTVLLVVAEHRSLAIAGLVSLNQTGAGLHDVTRDWAGLWCLTGVYFVLALLSTRFQRGSVHG